MNTEQNTVEQRAVRHAALGDPARLRITELLTLGDRSPAQLRQDLDLSSNLLAHHLGVLERAGLIRRSRSEGDRRRSYIQLAPMALDGLIVPPDLHARRIMFVCTGNSARSPLAAAIWTRISTIPATSAGTHPAPAVAPLATRIAAGHGLDITTHTPQGINEHSEPGDLLVTLCDRAHEELRGNELHWSIPNPGTIGTERAYERVYADLNTRITAFVNHLTTC